MVGETYKGSALGQRVKENRQAQGDLYVDRVRFEPNVAAVAASRIPDADKLRRVFVPFKTPEGSIARGELIVNAEKDIVDSFNPKTKKTIEGYVDVRLGQPDRMHKIAYMLDGELKTTNMTSQQLQDSVSECRAEYKAIKANRTVERAAEASNLSKDVSSVENSVPSLKDEEMKALRANADATVQSLRESAAATVAGLQSDADKSSKGLSL